LTETTDFSIEDPKDGLTRLWDMRTITSSYIPIYQSLSSGVAREGGTYGISISEAQASAAEEQAGPSEAAPG
jgi:hypothetical protein